MKIYISDCNRFFAQGLKYALYHYFSEKGIDIDVSETIDSDVHYSMAFIVVSNLSQYHYARKMMGVGTIFVIQADVKPILNRHEVAVRTLQRTQSLSCLFHQIDEVYALRNEVVYTPPHALLTEREKVVLDYYSSGYSNVEIARLLGIHQKTVSAHRINAMNKLNFKHKGEFRRWVIATDYQ
ncbi:response regulator transcription factor [Serratia fonticola]|uniref:response regulator transcription factor n=1 Tax=Serratia fonticola TaxID=47917 RepID=UPI000464C3EB|nr:LuxR C-terminal-related transcriptional regulator [Serratia fonticola]